MHTSPFCKGRAKICCEKRGRNYNFSCTIVYLSCFLFLWDGRKCRWWKLYLHIQNNKLEVNFFHPQSTCIDHTRKSTCVYTWFVKVNHVFYLWSVLRFNTGFHNTIKFYCCWVEMQSNLFLRWVYIKHDFSCTFTAHPFSEVYCCKFW